MSFRSRLSLFFTIIVVVPMVAVALVLFSIMADSETGKTDAAIAQGLRAAFAVYDGDRASAHDALHSLAGNSSLAQALASGDRNALQSTIAALQRSTPGVRGVAVFDIARRGLTAAGNPTSVAAAVATVGLGRGPVGYVAVSTTTAADFARQVSRLTGLDTRVGAAGQLLASTVPKDRGSSWRSGNVTFGSVTY